MNVSFQPFKSFWAVVFATFSLFHILKMPLLASEVKITNFGHSALLIKGGGKSILLNPFRAVGCAKDLSEPKISVDFIFASSTLEDEGARIAKGLFFVSPGSYQIDDFSFDGISSPHDRLGGRRYGLSTFWKWQQNGVKFAHLGGGASPLTDEHKLLLGDPDVLIIAVGGGDKVYDGKEAAEVVYNLNPKIVIPVQYRRKATIVGCDQKGIEPFLEAMKGVEVRKVGKSYKVSPKKIKEMSIYVMN